MHLLTKALSVLVISTATLVAKADTLDFVITGEGNSYTFSLPSNPVPHASASGILFDFDNVSVTVNGQVGLYDLSFFHAGVLGGGMEIDTPPYNDVFLGLDGPQLYTGTEDAPVFAPGTFGLGNPTTEATYSLVISEAGPPPVPEPSTLLLLGTGLISAVGAVRQKLATRD